MGVLPILLPKRIMPKQNKEIEKTGEYLIQNLKT
jgi:hypothetical protein